MFPPTPSESVREPDGLHDWMGIETPLSLIDLINTGSLTPRLTSLIWFLLSRRSSVVVAAAPRLAGKSTTLAALLPMTPPEMSFFPIGNSFSRETVRNTKAGSAYLVVNEVSPGLPHRYLWGDGVEELLRTRAEGHPVAVTLHAPTPEAALETFTSPPLAISNHLVRGLNMVVVLRPGDGPSGRGVESLALVEGGEEGRPLSVRYLARWDDRSAFDYGDHEATAQALARRSGLTSDETTRELEARERYLTDLVADSPDGSLREALSATFLSG
jgi:hypothetical protein